MSEEALSAAPAGGEAPAAPVAEAPAPVVAESAAASAPVAEPAAPAAEAAAAPQQPGESDVDYKARVHGLTKALAEARGELYRMRREREQSAAKPAGAATPAVNIPDANEDPHGAINALRELALEMIGERASTEEKAAKEAAQTQYVNELKGAYDASEAEYASVQPDYREAAQHYVKSRVAELTMLGSTPQDAQRAVYNEFLRVTDYALQNGRAPAELIYGLAGQRGYSRPVPVPVPAPVIDPLLAVEAGQAASKTISAAGARAPVADAGTPEEQLANLSGAALRSAWEKIKRDRFATAH